MDLNSAGILNFFITSYTVVLFGGVGRVVLKYTLCFSKGSAIHAEILNRMEMVPQ